MSSTKNNGLPIFHTLMTAATNVLFAAHMAFPPEQERLFLIIGLGVGNNSTPFTKSPGPETVFPNTLEVDWIRYYQRK
jgi:hypothetical protein